MADKPKIDPRLEMVTVRYTNPDPDQIPELGKLALGTDYPIEFVNREAAMKRVHAEVLIDDRASRLKFKIVE
jgi:hypothetical protein